MTRFQPVYTPEQKRAVIRAMLDASCTGPAAVALASAGELVDENGSRLAPFSMPVSTAYLITRAEKNTRLGAGASELSKADRPSAAKAIVNRTLDILETELRQLERQRPGGDGRDRERKAAHRVQHAERIARAAEQVLKLEKALAEKERETTGPVRGQGRKRDPEATALEREAKQRHAEQNEATPSVPPTESGVLHAAQRDASLRAEGQGNGASHCLSQPETTGEPNAS